MGAFTLFVGGPADGLRKVLPDGGRYTQRVVMPPACRDYFPLGEAPVNMTYEVATYKVRERFGLSFATPVGDVEWSDYELIARLRLRYPEERGR